MRKVPAWVLQVIGVTLLLAVTRAYAAENTGQGLFMRYCAPCHGVSGQGPGVDASAFVGQARNLQDPALLKYSAGELVRRLEDGRRLNLALDPVALRAQSRDVEDLFSHIRRLAQISWTSVEEGWALYSSRCATCHGVYGQPPAELPKGVRQPRDLSSLAFQSSLNDAALTEAVRHGRQAMPALTPQVTASEARFLTAFVRLMSPGFRIYQRYCAMCHGDNGRGVVTVLGETERKPSVVFNRNYFAKNDSEAIRVRLWHMVDEKTPSMPHFRGTLSEEQLRSIVGFLREGMEKGPSDPPPTKP